MSNFVADQAGTYWYHSHQVSNPQVAGGLLGSLVVAPRSGIAQPVEVSAIAHTYSGLRTINGKGEDLRVPAQPGHRLRVRVTNTDNGPMKIWSSGSYRLLAVDGTEVQRPTEVSGRSVTLTAGARADLEVTAPDGGPAVRVQLSKATAVVIGAPGGDAPVPPQSAAELDLLNYGSPAPLGFDPVHPSRQFEYRIGRRPGFVKGRPGVWWSINGRLSLTFRCMSYARVTWWRCTSQTTAAKCIRCTCMATMWSCWLAMVWPPPEPVVGRLAQRASRRDLRHRVRSRQPWHLDGPLPQPQTRRPRHDRAPHVRGVRHPYRIAGAADNQPE